MKSKILISLLAISLLFTVLGAQPTYAAEDPPITIYVVPPITDEKTLPTTSIPDGYISNEVSIVASPGEYEPASFVIKALDDINALEVVATELEGESSSIPSNDIDIRWFPKGRIQAHLGYIRQRFHVIQSTAANDTNIYFFLHDSPRQKS